MAKDILLYYEEYNNGLLTYCRCKGTNMNQNTPTKAEIKFYLDTVEKLSIFEAEHRCIRGWGLWSETDTLPIPQVIKVQSWLKSLLEDDTFKD